jgi:hypothetical protein
VGRNAAIVGVLAVLMAGCQSDGGGKAQGCSPVTREALDPNYLVHVLEDSPSLEYRSDPPTSGPHQPGPPVHGVVDHALSRPVQVGILERGDVVIQYRPDDVDAADLESLASGEDSRVVVAPNPDLPEPVVATAWLYKRTCDRAATDPLQAFVDARIGHGPDDK